MLPTVQLSIHNTVLIDLLAHWLLGLNYHSTALCWALPSAQWAGTFLTLVVCSHKWWPNQRPSCKSPCSGRAVTVAYIPLTCPLLPQSAVTDRICPPRLVEREEMACCWGPHSSPGNTANYLHPPTSPGRLGFHTCLLDIATNSTQTNDNNETSTDNNYNHFKL